MTNMAKVTLSANELDQISGGVWDLKEKIAAGAAAAATAAAVIVCGWAISKKKKNQKEKTSKKRQNSCSCLPCTGHSFYI